MSSIKVFENWIELSTRGDFSMSHEVKNKRTSVGYPYRSAFIVGRFNYYRTIACVWSDVPSLRITSTTQMPDGTVIVVVVWNRVSTLSAINRPVIS